MDCRADLFSIPSHVCYLNAAYMSPNLKTVAEAGMSGLNRKNQPYEVTPQDFFTEGEKVKALFNSLIGGKDAQRVAILPSVSYGLANVANNIPHKPNGEIVLVTDEFPSNVYVWQKLAERRNYTIKMISRPLHKPDSWDEQILTAINNNTVAVSLSTVHWTNGYKFDLPSISSKARFLGVPFILDGTQSIGAMPFNIQDCPADALICAGYKWLLGPYSIGLGYYGPLFDHGIPIEDNWINREDSENFPNLTMYNQNYKGGAGRYSVGESAHFIQLPMLIAALEQILKWGVINIQEYCLQLRHSLEQALESKGLSTMAEFNAYAGHLFPIGLVGMQWTGAELNKFLRDKNIFVSVRGSWLRIAPHVYNHPEQMIYFAQMLKEAANQGAFNPQN